MLRRWRGRDLYDAARSAHVCLHHARGVEFYVIHAPPIAADVVVSSAVVLLPQMHLGVRA